MGDGVSGYRLLSPWPSSRLAVYFPTLDFSTSDFRMKGGLHVPIVDRREFGGRFTVKENSQRLANYRYLEIQLMEMIGGWSHTTPQLAYKATFGYHVYDHAQAADLLSERLEQLRAARTSQEPATDEFARLCEHVWNPRPTPSTAWSPSTACWSRTWSAATSTTPTPPTR